MRLQNIILFPLSIKYSHIVYLRNKFFDWGLFKSHEFKTASICVGNIALGGTGKTPMIDLLIKYYKDKNITVLSRGYGRKTKGLIHAQKNSTASEIGDEPKQLLDANPSINVVVCKDRVKGMRYIEEHIQADLVLLDDAFQHRRIKAKVNVLLTTFTRPFFKDHYLPLGTLRDHKISVSRADLLLVTKSPDVVSLAEQHTFKSHFKDQKAVYFANLKYADSIRGEEGAKELSTLKNKKVHLVTGIANPEPLITFLNQKGISFTHFKFKDHYSYTAKDIERFNSESALVLTTEKDYVKLKIKCKSLYFLGVAHQIDKKDSFFDALNKKLGS